MHQKAIKEIIAILVKASNCPIQDYYHFPDIIFIGKEKIGREQFNYLLSQELIVAFKWDSFGKYYNVTKKGEDFIYNSLPAKQPYRRKRIEISYMQGCFSFS